MSLTGRLGFCPFPKYEGDPWEEVVAQDRDYVLWLVGPKGPEMDPILYDRLIELLEDTPEEDR